MGISQKKGFTLFELVTVTAIVGIVGGMSFVQLKKMKIRQLKDEAKLQLGHLHKNQALYRFKHRKYADGIETVAFPQGTMRYNVGYTNPDPGSDPDFHDHDRYHQYSELCHSSRDCDILPSTVPDIPPTGKCGANDYKAYAVGDIYDDTGSLGSLDNSKLDKWSMDQDGNLDNCQDPTGDVDTC